MNAPDLPTHAPDLATFLPFDPVHGLIGLYIGSRTPPEIAVSILAEITAVKNGVSLPAAAHVAVAKEKLGPSIACATS